MGVGVEHSDFFVLQGVESPQIGSYVLPFRFLLRWKEPKLLDVCERYRCHFVQLVELC